MPIQTGDQSGEPMLLKIIVVGAVLIGVMAAIRDGRVLKDAGLLSTCTVAPVNGKPDPTLLACTNGRLDGFPDMTSKSSRLAGRLLADAQGMSRGISHPRSSGGYGLKPKP
jgi:hypothetical protein